MIEQQITEKILNCALKVHSRLGPGLLGSSYEACLFYELLKSGFYVEKQKPLPLVYDSVRLEVGYRIDLLVEGKVVLEIKSTDALNDVHLAQIITYLKLSGCKVGLLINFNVKHLKEGIKRVVV
jgi:GxxExxY protein